MLHFDHKSGSYIGLGIIWAAFIFAIFFQPIHENIISPISSTLFPLHSLRGSELKNSSREVFGFLPHWNFDNAQNINFETLTTLAYFDIKVDSTGYLMTDDVGYQTFVSQEATEIFKKAHEHGTRVVLTLTLFDNDGIEIFLDDSQAQERLIQESVSLVEKRGIDGINLDFEYDGDAGPVYRAKFTEFAGEMTERMHAEVPSSKVTVSVYASGVKYPKVQDIGAVAAVTDGVFMMGYDFAVASSDVAMPTAPLNGYKEGKYWYDISTAVEDFLAVMPADKLILGTPWYGLNFQVYEPGFKAETLASYYWGSGGNGTIQTYEAVKNNITPANNTDMMTGWDEVGQVGWKAYYDEYNGTWRQVYMDDTRSLGAKYDLAKEKGLLGVGIWALGFEGNNSEMWDLLESKFGNKIADVRISNKPIYELL